MVTWPAALACSSTVPHGGRVWYSSDVGWEAKKERQEDC